VKSVNVATCGITKLGHQFNSHHICEIAITQFLWIIHPKNSYLSFRNMYLKCWTNFKVISALSLLAVVLHHVTVNVARSLCPLYLCFDGAFTVTGDIQFIVSVPLVTLYFAYKYP
jgi:hypothetical protein